MRAVARRRRINRRRPSSPAAPTPASRSPTGSKPRSRSRVRPTGRSRRSTRSGSSPRTFPLVDDSATPNLIRIDPATNEIAATISLPDRLCQGFTASEDAIWACAADALIRIDPATNAITDTVPVTGAQYAYRPAAGAGYLWFLGSGDSVADTVIALDTGAKSTRTFQQSGTVGGMAYAFDALWLTIPGEGAS